jgi:hypothetical protein
MEVLLTKSQKSGMFSSSISFVLHMQAKLTSEEADLVKRYKMGGLVIYDKDAGMVDKARQGDGWRSLAAGLMVKALKLQITINDMINGRSLELKDINEMMAANAQIKEAAENFHGMLMASKHFEGEEVLKFAN